MPLVAGIDSSTQSTKVELRDVATGVVIGTGRSPHTATTPPLSEQDPSVWWAALVLALGQAVASADHASPAREIVALAVAGQQHGLVVLDRDGEVIRPAKLWNDTQSSPDADHLLEKLSATGWAEACGSIPVAAFTITKLAWLRRCEPDSFAKLAHVLLPHDWLNFKLTGNFVTDRGDASGTGYWSAAEHEYRLDLLSLVDDQREWSGVLPEVRGPREMAGVLSHDAATELGLEAGTPVAIGTGDNMAGALGLGLNAGDVAISIGTSGTVFTTSTRATHDPSGAVAGFADATGNFLPLVCTLNASMVTDSIRGLLSLDHAEFDELALSAPSGSGGLSLVPYFAGERTPNRPNASGSLHGIRTDVNRENLARSAFEGVVCGLLDGLDALAAAGVATDSGRLVLIGGGAQSTAYRQVLATLAERDVTVPDDSEIVSAGAGVQAAALATRSDVGEIARSWELGLGAHVEPETCDVAAHEVRTRYAKARA
jgi:xylulokinase